MINSSYSPSPTPSPAPASPAAPLAPLPPSPYEAFDRPLHSAPLGAPKSDREAMDLVMSTKAALDHQTGRHANAHPAVRADFQNRKQAHIDHAAKAIHQYHAAKPSAFSQSLVDAMHSDPNIKISHAKPGSK